MALADKYFKETVINGGSILSPLSAQPILRMGGCSAILCIGRRTLVRFALQTKMRAERAGGGILLLIT